MRKKLILGGMITLTVTALAAFILWRMPPALSTAPEEAAEKFLTDFFTVSIQDAQKNNEKLQKLPRDDAEAAQGYVEKWASEFGFFTEEGLLSFAQNGYLRMNNEFVTREQTEMEALAVELTAEEEEERRKRYTFRAEVGMTGTQGQNSKWIYEGWLIEILEDGVWKIDGFKVRKSREA